MGRISARASIEIQDRDTLILRGLFESRVMTLAHISMLYFSGRGEAAKKRVQKLKAAGLVAERPRGPREPSILFLAKRGYEHLLANNELDGFPKMTWPALAKRVQVSHLTLPHELEIMNVKAAFSVAIEKTDCLQVMEFTTWPALNRFDILDPLSGERHTVEPDGFLRVLESTPHERFEHAFFLEVDRSHESVGRVVQQMARYRAYYVTGGFANVNGSPHHNFSAHPFRVLFVTKSQRRVASVAEALLKLNPAILTLVWLGDVAGVVASPLERVWQAPIDFRGAAGRSPRRLFESA